VVHVEGFYMAQHVPGQDRTPRLLVEQNVEFSLWRQRALIAPAAERAALLHEADRTRRAEIRAWARSDVLAAVADEDRQVIESTMPTKPVRLVPDGVDHLAGRGAACDPAVVPDTPHVVFVGNFGYEPNVDAARFLCREVMPRVVMRVPDARLLLVGASPPPAVVELEDCHPSVRITGPVPDVTPFLVRADAVVCPLRIGGGVKVKMLEALSLGKAIVATSVAAQGIPDADHACAIADDPATFADAVVMMLTDADLRRTYEQRATRVATALPTWDAAAADLMTCYARLVRGVTPAELVD
jgi:glycosyltransferase involved in cell wall biosynthesis